MKITAPGLLEVALSLVGVLLLAAFGWYARESTWMTSAVSGAIGGLLVIGIQGAIAYRRRARLEVSFIDGADCLAPTKTIDQTTGIAVGQALYLRLRVKNEGSQIAKACRAYLVSADRFDSSGGLPPSIYSDSLPLTWSCSSPGKGAEPLDLPRGVAQYVDIVSTHDQAGPYLWRMEFPTGMPVRYQEHFRGFPRRYRFTVLVAGDGVDPVTRTVDVSLGDSWDSLKATAVAG